MSRGLGVVQRRLIAALQAEPSRWFTVLDLAEVVYGEPVERKHLEAVRRVLRRWPVFIARAKVSTRFTASEAS